MKSKKIPKLVPKQRIIEINSIEQLGDSEGDCLEVIQVVFNNYKTGVMRVAEIACGFKIKSNDSFIEIKRCVNGKNIDIRHTTIEEYIPVFPNTKKEVKKGVKLT